MISRKLAKGMEASEKSKEGQLEYLINKINFLNSGMDNFPLGVADSVTETREAKPCFRFFTRGTRLPITQSAHTADNEEDPEGKL